MGTGKLGRGIAAQDMAADNFGKMELAPKKDKTGNKSMAECKRPKLANMRWAQALVSF